jgi:hypothetical protein
MTGSWDSGTLLGQQIYWRDICQTKTVPNGCPTLANGTVGQQVNPPEGRGLYRCIVELSWDSGTAVGQSTIFGGSAMKTWIAEGDHIFWIVKANVVGDRLEVVFDTHGKLLTELFPLTGSGVWRVKEMLESCGKEVNESAFAKAQSGKRPKINVKRLIGLECGGTVLDDGWGKLIIATFYPASNLQNIFSHPEVPKHVM